ncbi:hypothetical protein NBRC110019_05100 [Neptunitalea chrysea]|uniref:Uncharacterized protein n=1 Tax=Neptunitalea chrysea TaxID=1647581 RepID=A0A9W6EUA9_9FLAO|nr:hypothetical protein NBRC110019_05100 [Neptunitalea chrysea]
MFTIGTTLTLLGFSGFYVTSKRADIHLSDTLLSLVKSNTRLVKGVSFLFLIAAIIPFIVKFGIGGGLLFFSIVLMTAGGCVIMFQPLQLFKIIQLIVFFLVCFLIECLV